MKPQINNDNKAFTLLELLIVVAILAIIGGAVIVAYKGTGDTAEENLVEQRLAGMKQALLNFRQDMGYFPGEGPLGDTATVEPVAGQLADYDTMSAVEKSLWRNHELNHWMLYFRPNDTAIANKWVFDSDAKRGWNGPYLNAKSGLLLDNAGTLASAFVGGGETDALLSVDDAFGRSNGSDDSSPLYWRIINNPDITQNARFGRPIAFIEEVVTGTPDMRVYLLVSFGKNGKFEFQGIAENNGDDAIVEVARIAE
ncbi:MAG: type II secretion system GspH family protein [Verrucomicrobiales bacterium]|nr:type II secretion system GspH family protein [Verrucomicrobiales bacterium]